MIDDHRVRIYYASTDEQNVGRVGYLELDVREPRRVLEVSSDPVLDIGRPGTFDDNGVNPCSIVRVGDRLRLYYVGYQLQRQIPYTLFTGVAESTDGGKTFERQSEVPVLDRREGELFFRTAPFVLQVENRWQMWYVAGAAWTGLGGRTQPLYSLHTIGSDDGIVFPGSGRPLMAPNPPEEIGFGRPFIRSLRNESELYYSIRTPMGYRLGYAKSVDRITWTRCDADLEFDGAVEPWESEMLCYSAIVDAKGTTLMFYNGNGYGRTGFGVAVLEQA